MTKNDKSIIGDMTLDDLDSVRHMDRVTADAFIARFNLTPDQSATVKKLVGLSLNKDPVNKLVLIKDRRIFDPSRRIFWGALWLLGASYRQIAEAYGVTPQSVLNSINRVLPKDVRALGRVGLSMTADAFDSYMAVYEEDRSPFHSRTPMEAAAYLLSTIEVFKNE